MPNTLFELLEARRLLTAAVADVSEETFVGGLTQPTVMTFAPDGRLFVSLQGGLVRIVKGGQVLPDPFLSVQVDTNGERGLVGLELDPAFATNGYVYIYWTATTPTLHNRISRFTADPAHPDVALPGSRVDLLDLPDLGAVTHNGGSMHFGPDGKLYVGVGENSVPARAQALDNPFGKILRLNKDGTIPTDDPFYAQGTGLGRATYALGLRNPFTFAFQPGTGRMFINDVGGSVWEEIDQGVAGANFGWPTAEGPTTDPRFTGPVYTYKHVGDKTVSGGVITGAAFYNPPAGATAPLPPSLAGRYFFGDGLGRFVKSVDPANPATTVAPFATEVTNAVDIDVGPDGALYVLNRNNGYNVSSVLPGRVLRYTFDATGAPSIGTPPAAASAAAGDSVTFTVGASGTAPLTYQWQRNGQDIPGATTATYTLANVSAADAGALFRVVVSNAAGSVTSAAAALAVEAGGAPVPVISTPATDARFVAGRPVNFAGSATDPEDGVLAPAKLTWTVTFFTAGLERPFLPDTAGITSGTFTPEAVTPYLATDVFYRVRLTATDSSGLARSTFVDVKPTLVNLTLATSTPGLALTLDGSPVTTPSTVSAVAGLTRPLGAPARQTLGGVVYDFAGWSDGGDREHNASTPETDVTFTAQYQPRVGTGTGSDLAGSVEVAAGGPAVVGAAGRATLRLTNAGSAKFSGRVPINLYLSSDPTLDPADVPAGSLDPKVALAAGKGKAVKAAFTYPAVAGGNYYLLADVDAGNVSAEADESNNVATTPSAEAVQAAVLDLSGTFAAAAGDSQRAVRAGKKVSAVLEVKLTGNVPVAGPLDVGLRLATDAAGTGAVDVGTVHAKVKIAPDGTRRLKLKFKVPADLAAGNYRLLALIDPAGAFADADPANNTVVDPVTYVVGA